MDKININIFYFFLKPSNKKNNHTFQWMFHGRFFFFFVVVIVIYRKKPGSNSDFFMVNDFLFSKFRTKIFTLRFRSLWLFPEQRPVCWSSKNQYSIFNVVQLCFKQFLSLCVKNQISSCLMSLSTFLWIKFVQFNNNVTNFSIQKKQIWLNWKPQKHRTVYSIHQNVVITG